MIDLQFIGKDKPRPGGMLRRVLFQNLQCKPSVVDNDYRLPENCDRAQGAYQSELGINTGYLTTERRTIGLFMLEPMGTFLLTGRWQIKQVANDGFPLGTRR